MKEFITIIYIYMLCQWRFEGKKDSTEVADIYKYIYIHDTSFFLFFKVWKKAIQNASIVEIFGSRQL